MFANVTLVSTAEGHTGGNFKVSTHTSNSPLNTTFLDAPVDSVLDFEGHASNSPAYARTHPTFEGEFHLRTSAWFPVTVQADEGVEDPAGKDRKRIFELRKVNRGTAEGNVKWLPEEEKTLGKVVLTTSNSPISLNL